jgi:hypothetical protein
MTSFGKNKLWNGKADCFKGQLTLNEVIIFIQKQSNQ